MANENVGHRQRMRERVLEGGLPEMRDHEVLEMFLYHCVPRKDTNKLAHLLLNSFGTIHNIMEATAAQLMTVEGVGLTVATDIAVAKEMFRRDLTSHDEAFDFNSMNNILKYAEGLLLESPVERMLVVYLDNAGKYLYREAFTSLNSQNLAVDNRRIFTTAVRLDAAAVLLFHCHPRGNCKPSLGDIDFTEHLTWALMSINAVVVDHIIIADSDTYYSFALNSDMRTIRENLKEKSKRGLL